MPVYDYKCKVCEHVFESINTRPTDADECPECGGPAERIPHTHQNLRKPGFVAPPLAKKKWGEPGRVAHKPARW